MVRHPAYHRRFGFRSVERLAHQGVPPEAFVVLSFGEHVPQGTVRFHEGFAAAGPPEGKGTPYGSRPGCGSPGAWGRG